MEISRQICNSNLTVLAEALRRIASLTACFFGPLLGNDLIGQPAVAFQINALPPPVVIEKVAINKKVFSANAKIETKAGKGQLEFHYTALCLSAPEKVEFKYKLEGFDDAWVEAGSRRIAYYTNIPPGEYAFRVIAGNNDGAWNERGAVFEFQLKPYFYQTNWFYGFCTIMFLLMGAGIYRLRVQQTRIREKRLAQLVEKRTKALQREVNEHQRTEQALRESEARFKAFMDNSPAVAFLKDEQGRYVYVNKLFERTFAFMATDWIGKTDFEVWPEQMAKQFRTGDMATLTADKTVELIETTPSLNGELSYWIVLKFPFKDTLGRRFLGGMAVDITGRKQAEEQIKASLKEKEVLLQEIHHRVKNNLQIISSLLNLQSRYIKDKPAREAFQESQNRVRTMALIHEKLYQSRDLASVDFAEYIRHLAGYLFRSYGVDLHLIMLKIDVETVLFDMDAAIPCGLIINELVSNSLKHAFPNGRGGEICLVARSAPRTNGDNRFALLVSDNGIGFPPDLDFRHTESLGLQLVLTLTNQLGGTIELDRTGGTTFRIEFSR